MSDTITLAAPVAQYDDDVLVLNYRCRPPRWERGTVLGARAVQQWSRTWDWQYTVRPEHYRGYDLVVGNERIRLMEPGR